MGMQGANNKTATGTIFWSLMWALAMIAAAFLFKGKPVAYWAESVLMVGALSFTILKPQQFACPR